MKKILIISKDLRNQGGVVDMVSMILKFNSNKYLYKHFSVGGAPKVRTHLLRNNVFADAIRLCLKTWFSNWDCIHINPSFVWRSLFRDITLIRVITILRSNKLLVFIHGWDDMVANKIKKSYSYRKIVSSTLNKCAVILVLASTFKDELTSIGVDSSKIFITSTMFDGKYLKQVKFVKNDEYKVILFLSRFVKEKGIYELLGAFKLLRSKSPKYRLLLAGDGPEMPGMKKYVEENELHNSVEFCGYVRDLKKAKILKSADIFVFPTYYGEGCPVSLLEAMAAGLPIVTASAGGIRDIFVNRVNGILLEEVSANSIKSAIELLFSDASKLAEIKAHNTSIAWEKYEASRATKYIEDMYDRVINQV